MGERIKRNRITVDVTPEQMTELQRVARDKCISPSQLLLDAYRLRTAIEHLPRSYQIDISNEGSRISGMSPADFTNFLDAKKDLREFLLRPALKNP